MIGWWPVSQIMTNTETLSNTPLSLFLSYIVFNFTLFPFICLRKTLLSSVITSKHLFSFNDSFISSSYSTCSFLLLPCFFRISSSSFFSSSNFSLSSNGGRTVEAALRWQMILPCIIVFKIWRLNIVSCDLVSFKLLFSRSPCLTKRLDARSAQAHFRQLFIPPKMTIQQF